MKILKHNRLDYSCVHWTGDMRPSKSDLTNTELDGRFTSVVDRRCVVCNPYSEEVANELLDVDLFSLV